MKAKYTPHYFDGAEGSLYLGDNKEGACIDRFDWRGEYVAKRTRYL